MAANRIDPFGDDLDVSDFAPRPTKAPAVPRRTGFRVARQLPRPSLCAISAGIAPAVMSSSTPR